MSAPTPVEYGEVLGYALAIWPSGELARYPVGHAEVWTTAVEARDVRNQLRSRPFASDPPDVRVVEIREVIVE